MTLQVNYSNGFMFLQGKAASKDDDPEPALMADNDRQELMISRQIQEAFVCLEHPKKACYVKTGNGEHYAFTAGDLSIWAGLVVSVRSSL